VPDKEVTTKEKDTIKTMITIYCKGNHKTIDSLCNDCSSLLYYACKRIDNCPVKESKTTCAQCTVHCYKPDMREKVRVVMRYSGPRMLFHHPVKTLLHYAHGLKKISSKEKNKKWK